MPFTYSYGVSDTGVAGGGGSSYLLAEDGTHLLLEDGTDLLAESGGGGDMVETTAINIGRPVSTTGVTTTDSTSSVRSHSGSDTALTFSDALTSVRTRAVSDTGETQSDSIAAVHVLPRVVSDTGMSFSESITADKGMTDTGADITSTTAINVARTAADTGETHSDSIAVAHVVPRTITDTGTTQTTTVASSRTRSLADTGVTHSDSAGRVFPRAASDTGATVTDSVSATLTRSISDTGTTFGASITTHRTHAISDTLTFSDSASRVGGTINLSDTGQTHTDSLVRSYQRIRLISETGAAIGGNIYVTSRSRSITQTGTTITDSVVRGRYYARTPSDTGVSSFSDSIFRSQGRQAFDTATAFSDSVLKQPGIGRQVADTAVTFSERVYTNRYKVTDTGVAFSDAVSLGGVYGKLLTDTGVTFADAAHRNNFVAPSADTGATVTDAVSTVRIHRAVLADAGYSHFDAIRTRPQAINDTGVTFSDRVFWIVQPRLIDTGVSFSDGVGLRRVRTPSDTGVTVTESIYKWLSGHLLVDAGVSFSDATGISKPFIIETGVTFSDAVGISKPFITDAGVAFFSDTVTKSHLSPRSVSDTGQTFSDSVVKAKGPPANDLFANRITLTPGSATITGTTATATAPEGSETVVGNAYYNVWYTLTSPTTRLYHFSLEKSPGPISEMQWFNGTALASLTLYRYDTWKTLGYGMDANVGEDIYGEPYGGWYGRLPHTREIMVKAGTPMQFKIGSAYIFNGGAMGPFQFSYQEITPPANDTPANAVTLSGDSGTVSGTTVGAYVEPVHTGLNIASYPRGRVWYTFTPSTTGMYIFDLDFTSGAYSIGVEILTGTSPTFTSIGYLQPDWFTDDGLPKDPLGGYGFQLTGGTTYTVVVTAVSRFADGGVSGPNTDPTEWKFPWYENHRGTFDMTWEFAPAPANDDFADADEIFIGTPSAFNDVRGATIESGEYFFGSPSTYPSIWHRFRPAESGGYQFTATNIYSPSGSGQYFRIVRGTSADESDLVSLDYTSIGDASLPYPDRTLSVSLEGGATYYIQVVNYGGSFPSVGSEISVEFIGATATNDDFADAELITGDTGTVSGSTVGGTMETDELVPYWWWAGTIQPTVWYRWVAPSSGTYNFNTISGGTEVDTSVAVYTGGSLATLTKVAGNDDSPPGNEFGYPSDLAFVATAGVTYRIQVASAYYQGIFDLNWSPVAVTATNHLFANATVITGNSGSVTSNNYAITPDNEVGSFDLAHMEDSSSPEDDYGRTLWFAFTPPTTQQYDITLSSEYDNIQWWLAVFSGSAVNALTLLAGNGDYRQQTPFGQGAFTLGYGELSFRTTTLTAGTTYHILVAGQKQVGENTADTNQGPFTLEWAGAISASAPENDNMPLLFYGSPKYDLSWDDDNNADYPGAGSLTFTSKFATAQAGEPAHGGVTASKTVWFYFENPYTDRQVKFWTTSSTLTDQTIAIYPYNYDMPTAGQLIAFDDNSGPGNMPEVTFNAQEWKRYAIVVDTKDAVGDEFDLHWQWLSTGTPPANDDFANAEVITGSSPSFVANVVGATPEPGEPGDRWNSVWYKWTAPSSGAAFLSVTAPDSSSFDWTLYTGTALNNLVYVQSGDTGTYTFAAVAGTTYYFRVSGSYGEETATAVSFAAATQPPFAGDNNNYEDATDVGGADAPDGEAVTVTGDTSGSTLQPGEDDDNPTGGSTWHKITTGDRDELVKIEAIHNASANAGTPGERYRNVTLYEGNSIASAKKIVNRLAEPASYPASASDISTPGSIAYFNFFYYSYQPFWKLRKNTTYFIQVRRDEFQLWGPYTLTIKRWREHPRWDQPSGWDTISNASDVSANRLVVSGGAGSAEISPFGRNGASCPQPVWFRTQMRVSSGQVLERGFSGSNWASQGNRHLRFLEVYDDTNTLAMWAILRAEVDGRNYLYFSGPGDGDAACSTGISLGTKEFDDNSWVNIEIIFQQVYPEGYLADDPTQTDFTYVRADTVYQAAHVIVDGVYQGSTGLNCSRLRKFSVGAIIYPSVSKYEADPEVWTVEFRDTAVTDRMREDGGLGFPRHDSITAFAGFCYDRRPRSIIYYNPSPSIYSGFHTIGPGSTVDNPPLPPVGDRDFNVIPGDNTIGQAFNAGIGSTRVWSGQWVHFTQFPLYDWERISVWNGAWGDFPGLQGDNAQAGAGYLYVRPSGELWCSPAWHGTSTKSQRLPTYCVARLSLDTWYWIESVTDYSIHWDVTTEVWINNVYFGKMPSWNSGIGPKHYFPYNSAEIGSVRWLYSDPDTTFYFGPVAFASHAGTQLENPEENPAPVGAITAYGRGLIDSGGTHGIPDVDPDDLVLSGGEEFQNEWLFNYLDKSPNMGDGSRFPGSGATSDGGFPARVYSINPDPVGHGNFEWNHGSGATYLHNFFSATYPTNYPLPNNFGVGDVHYTECWARSSNSTTDFELIDDVVSEDEGFYYPAWTGGERGLTPYSKLHYRVSFARHYTGLGGNGRRARGHARLGSVAPGTNLVISRVRWLMNPYVFPRFGLSTDGGNTYDLIFNDDALSAAVLSDDPGDTDTTFRVYLDNSASMWRPQETRGYVNSDLFFGPGPASCSLGLRHTDYHLEYTIKENHDIDPDDILFANICFRGGGFHYYPNAVTNGGSFNGQIYPQLKWNGMRKNLVGMSFNGQVAGTPLIYGKLPISPDGEGWNNFKLSGSYLRLGFWKSDTETGNPGRWYGQSPWNRATSQFNGAWISGAGVEYMGRAEPGEVPPPCSVRVFSVEMTHKTP